MAAVKVLRMVFKDEGDASRSVNVMDPKDTLTSNAVEAVMDSIISKNVFDTRGGALVSKVKAEIVETERTAVFTG